MKIFKQKEYYEVWKEKYLEEVVTTLSLPQVDNESAEAISLEASQLGVNILNYKLLLNGNSSEFIDMDDSSSAMTPRTPKKHKINRTEAEKKPSPIYFAHISYLLMKVALHINYQSSKTTTIAAVDLKKKEQENQTTQESKNW